MKKKTIFVLIHMEQGVKNQVGFFTKRQKAIQVALDKAMKFAKYLKKWGKTDYPDYEEYFTPTLTVRKNVWVVEFLMGDVCWKIVEIPLNQAFHDINKHPLRHA